MRNAIVALVLVALVPAFVFGATTSSKMPDVKYPLITGDEVIHAAVTHPPYGAMDNTDVIGTTTIIGTTWYDVQHNGTIGRMVELDDTGYLHFVWMNGLDYGATQRHIYYNYVDPFGSLGWPDGYPVESANRAGYTTVDVDFGGLAFPCFHQTNIPGGDFNTATATDFFPHSGTFIVYEAPTVPGVPEVIWPRIQFDNQQYLQIVSTENPASGVAGDPQRHYFHRGTYNPGTFAITYDPYQEMTWTMTIAGDVATSDVSDRVAYAWTYPMDPAFPTPGGDYSQRDNDVFVVIDDDGINPDWNNPMNITQFLPPDLSYLPDTLLADMDTIRAYTDLNVFFDQDDYLHVTFTTPSYFALEGTSYWHASIIWHWTEQYPDDFTMVHNAFDDWDWNFIDCGAWNVKAQRPSLGQDPTTGNLFCTYMVYDVDTLAQSAGGWPSGEVYVSVSEDGGVNWAVGTNITQTVTPNNAAPGQCLAEIYPSMAKKVDGNVHITYVMDKDAGVVVQTEGTWTLNDVIYHKVPVNLIPTTPLVVQNVPFHVEVTPPPVPDLMVDINYVSGSPVPAGGGQIFYAIFCENTGPVPLDWDGWINMVYEGGPTSFTIVNRQDILNFLPGWTVNRPDLQYPVPGSWPGGNYEAIIYSGDYPNVVWHTDSFAWVKEGTVDLDFDFEAHLPTEGVSDPFDNIAVTQEDYTVPTAYEVHGAYPNPFNPSTTISFALPQDAKVMLSVYDVNGRLVETLVNGNRSAGVHDVTFDASSLSSGVYLYRLEAGEFNATGKMILMK